VGDEERLRLRCGWWVKRGGVGCKMDGVDGGVGWGGVGCKMDGVMGEKG